jgi:hypothetical protein
VVVVEVPPEKEIAFGFAFAFDFPLISTTPSLSLIHLAAFSVSGELF